MNTEKQLLISSELKTVLTQVKNITSLEVIQGNCNQESTCIVPNEVYILFQEEQQQQ
jgi:hypothetical protein